MGGENLYEKYFLVENPFPIVPIPEEQPQVLGANQNALDRIFWQLNKVVMTGHPIHIVLVGPYGSGKTHLLRYLASQINQNIKGGLAAYVPHPGPDFISIYKRFVDNIGYERLKNLAKEVDERKLKENIIYHDFVTALANLNNVDKTLEAWRWLSANTLTLEERRSLRVATSIEHEEEALNAFSALLKFLRSIGFKLICMLVDEFEEINSLAQLQKRRLFNDLRHLIDLNVSNFSLIIACTPHGWETIYEENAALTRRFSSNVIFLEPLEENDAIELISSYLNRCRIRSVDLKKILADNCCDPDLSDIYPFTKDALKELCSLSKGNIGEILKYSGIAIEMGLKEGHKILDNKRVRHLIAKYYGKTVEEDAQ